MSHSLYIFPTSFLLCISLTFSPFYLSFSIDRRFIKLLVYYPSFKPSVFISPLSCFYLHFSKIPFPILCASLWRLYITWYKRSLHFITFSLHMYSIKGEPAINPGQEKPISLQRLSPALHRSLVSVIFIVIHMPTTSSSVSLQGKHWAAGAIDVKPANRISVFWIDCSSKPAYIVVRKQWLCCAFWDCVFWLLGLWENVPAPRRMHPYLSHRIFCLLLFELIIWVCSSILCSILWVWSWFVIYLLFQCCCTRTWLHDCFNVTQIRRPSISWSITPSSPSSSLLSRFPLPNDR